jgi:hypothetical protein
LVVVAIIALLMSLLMPSLERARQQARESVCKSNLKHWGIVFSMYADSYDGQFHDYGCWPVEGAGDVAGCHRWPVSLEQFYSDPKLRFCPMASAATWADGGAPIRFGAWFAEMPLPGDNFVPYGSYGANEWTCSKFLGDPDFDDSLFWKTPSVRRAANIPLISDCWWAGGFPEYEDPPPEYDGEQWGEGQMRRYCIARHGDGIIMCFVDFSVRKVGLKQLWGLKWHRSFRTDLGPRDDVVCGSAGGWPCWMENFRRYE